MSTTILIISIRSGIERYQNYPVFILNHFNVSPFVSESSEYFAALFFESILLTGYKLFEILYYNEKGFTIIPNYTPQKGLLN